jgi:hypothetical protein
LSQRHANSRRAGDIAAANAATAQKGNAKILRAKGCFGLSIKAKSSLGEARGFTAPKTVFAITGTARIGHARHRHILWCGQQEEVLWPRRCAKNANYLAFRTTLNAHASRYANVITGRAKCAALNATKSTLGKTGSQRQTRLSTTIWLLLPRLEARVTYFLTRSACAEHAIIENAPAVGGRSGLTLKDRRNDGKTGPEAVANAT